jgi:hypothetical protein
MVATTTGKMAVDIAIVHLDTLCHPPIDPNARWGDRFIIPIVLQQDPLELLRFEAAIQVMPAISIATGTVLAANRRL